jgi:hypothetical protein
MGFWIRIAVQLLAIFEAGKIEFGIAERKERLFIAL